MYMALFEASHHGRPTSYCLTILASPIIEPPSTFFCQPIMERMSKFRERSCMYARYNAFGLFLSVSDDRDRGPSLRSFLYITLIQFVYIVWSHSVLMPLYSKP